MWLRLCIGPNAFGNALGSSFVDSLQNSGERSKARTGKAALLASNDVGRTTASDVDNPYQGLVLDDVQKATETSDASFKAMVDKLQDPKLRLDKYGNPPASRTAVTLDDLGNPVGPLTNLYDLSDQANHSDYLNAVNRRIVNGLPLDAQDISTSKAILFHYQGYSMGAVEASASANRTVSQQLAGNLDSETSAPFLSAMGRFAASSPSEQTERYNFYSNIHVVYDQNGSATNARTVDLAQGDRTITLNWSPDFADLAHKVGVGPDEALRKTSFSVYQSVKDAAFSTDGLDSLTINGAWRPSVADYKAINGEHLPAGFSGWWSPAHVSSNGVDINNINGGAVNGGNYTNHHASTTESSLISNFIDNLATTSNSHQIFSPWQMNADIRDNFVFATNSGVSHNEKIHGNHIHFGTNGN